jgi:signal transduction histidine kinase
VARVNPQTYGAISLEADAPHPGRGYRERVSQRTSAIDRLTGWFRDLDPWAIDAVLGTVFTVASLVAVLNTADTRTADYADTDALAVLLALAFGLPFYVRRRLPLASLLVASTSLTLMALIGYSVGVQAQMLLVSAYTVGAHTDGVRRTIGLLYLESVVVVVAVVGLPDASSSNVLLFGVTYAVSFLLGYALRTRGLYLDQLEERARLLERERDEEARRAVADERLRIAQELHDVVAHSMGVIAVQAGVGAHVIDDDPVEAKRSLEAISDTSRGTLAEIRRLLGTLRADGDGAYEPAPGLADLDALVRDVTAAGVEVTLHVDGAGRTLPAALDLTAYRILQEALTNVLKHAGPACATVTVTYGDDALHLEVADDGHGNAVASSGGGHGLLGMRERVAVYGGSLDAAPASGGGFRVRARLPYGEAG